MSAPEVFEDGEWGILWDEEPSEEFPTEDNEFYTPFPGEETWDN